MEFLREDGTVDRSEYSLTIQETYPNTNGGDGTNADVSSGDPNSNGGDSSENANSDSAFRNVAGSAASERPLTGEEKQAIEYIFTAALPGLGSIEQLRIALLKSLSDVRIVDGSTSNNPIVLTAMGNGYGAITLGSNQFYQRYPKPNDIGRFALIAHETLHSVQAEAGGGTPGFLSSYIVNSLSAWYYEGDSYQKNMFEIHAYAMEDTVKEMLKDPAFAAAIANGTTGQLPDSYRTTIQNFMHRFLNERLQAK